MLVGISLAFTFWFSGLLYFISCPRVLLYSKVLLFCCTRSFFLFASKCQECSSCPLLTNQFSMSLFFLEFLLPPSLVLLTSSSSNLHSIRSPPTPTATSINLPPGPSNIPVDIPTCSQCRFSSIVELEQGCSASK